MKFSETIVNSKGTYRASKECGGLQPCVYWPDLLYSEQSSQERHRSAACSGFPVHFSGVFPTRGLTCQPSTELYFVTFHGRFCEFPPRFLLYDVYSSPVHSPSSAKTSGSVNAQSQYEILCSRHGNVTKDIFSVYIFAMYFFFRF